MNWSYSAVAFIDVLGFSSFVEADARSVEPARLLKLQGLLAGVKSSATELDVRAFSDSITISAPLESSAVAISRQKELVAHMSTVEQCSAGFGSSSSCHELMQLRSSQNRGPNKKPPEGGFLLGE